ncbi:MAG: rod shape-determining protein [Chloroflexi bacterium]|jgi:rod shape-determining protein MreB|nr:rod shape-determining protein [Chloroflexota bacterium]
MFGKQIGIDLGTVNVIVFVRGKGVVLNEPSVVAISRIDNRMLAVGDEARAMLGRTPETIEVSRPVRDGVIADYEVTEGMLRYFITKLCSRIERRPEVMLSVPVGVTTVESRAVREAAVQAGARVAYLIPEPLAAALGANLPVDTPTGNMVVNIGGGTAEAAVISMHGIVVSSSVRVAGNKLDEAIAAYVRRKYNLIVGDHTAELVKITIGSAMKLDEPLTMEVRGRDQVAGLPRIVTISSDEVTESLEEPLSTIAENVKSVLERTPPELASDIIDRGMVMTGGSSLLRNIDRFLTKETGIPCHLAENPMLCTALGAAKGLERLPILRRSLQTT